MKLTLKFFILLFIPLALSSCVTKKKYLDLENQFEVANKDLGKCGESLSDYMNRLAACDQDRATLKSTLKIREEQVNDLKFLIEDLKKQRDMQAGHVEGLTTLSQSASDNIKETLAQLEGKDKYIRFIQAAKTRADSINLALAINLKGVLQKGIEDEDVEVKVDKTVVFINLSDKMLYQSGSADITPRANEVLGKIAQIIDSRPDLEVMVEGYTDNVPIKNDCLQDNWDLSVKRATSVVRVLQGKFNIDPNRLIAAGRGQYNVLASNDTAEGRATNRRTRIIIMPKLNQFYDLLNPEKAPK
ncbi:MAG: OmpA family protein [Saprospiraceae bacterium]|nr:OmpA family protein [Saprospiraceae bacterium]MCB9325449.1 OmpA family protein [Lewinellaceae bacterium]